MMKILLRKVRGEGAALICTERSGLMSLRGPTLLETALSFAWLLLIPLIGLAVTLLALHVGAGGHDGIALAIAPIFAFKADRAKLAKEANDALEAAQKKAKAENRGLSDEEKKAQDDYDKKLAAIDESIAMEQKKLDRERMIDDGRTPATGSGRPGTRLERVHDRAEDDTIHRGFRSPRDFLQAVINASGLRDRADVQDERLHALAVTDRTDNQAAGDLVFMLPQALTPRGFLATAGSDEQGVYDDRYGGFAAGRSMVPGILEVGFEGDPTSGRTQAVPMATPTVDILARTDKNHTSSVTGGFTVARRAETVAATASRSTIEMITLKASSLFGLAYATEEILADSVISFLGIIDAGFRTQFAAHMLNEKLRGKGGDQYLGILTSLAASSLGPTISIAKESGQVADTIVTNNVLNMRARTWGYSDAIWLANHDCFPELARLSVGIGTAGALVYQQSLLEDRPDMLLGRPIFYSEFCATKGDQGDIICANFSQYLDGLYQPLQSAESIHVRFDRHERALKFWLRNAGAPWWKTALTPNKSADTLSPFVVLDAR